MMMIILIIGLIIIDIVSKMLIKGFLNKESIVIIKNFFSITYVKNTGAAWSMFNDKPVFLIIISGIIIIGIIYYIWKNKPRDKWEKLLYSLVIAGAMGNFINRLFFGYVIDFIDIDIFGYDYPIFNIADIYVVLGILGLIIYTWKVDKNGYRSIK